MVVATLRLPRRGAESELDRLYRRHADEVLRYAQLVLRSRPDAEDVVQTTFVRAFRALERGERVQKPRNWLIKIAHNECRRLLAARKFDAPLPETLSAEEHDPGRAEELTQALKVLAPAQRQALVMRELEGRSYAEIAEALELSPSAVETLLFRARRAVREQLELGVTCEEFPALLEAGDRARVRAHTRVCAECATLERQARGRKGALRRIASGFFFPKLAAALLATSAAVGIGVAELPQQKAPELPPLQVDKPAVVHLAPQPTIATKTPSVVVPPTTKKQKTVPGTRSVPGTVSTHLATPTPTEPTPTPAPEPEPEQPLPPTTPVHEHPAPQVPAPVLPLDTQPVTQLVPQVTIPSIVQPVVQTVTTVTDTVTQTVDPVVQAVPQVTPPQLPLPPVLP